ncbi:MAG: NAD(P)-binding domain-containing protein [Chloroflexi bacterium]|nr:NAD(P)-binding domain-containing protein [Chloroflexota bacterium]
MVRIGFIGLGVMGRPMAQNLLMAGYPLVVYNRSRPAMEHLAEDGAQIWSRATIHHFGPSTLWRPYGTGPGGPGPQCTAA